MVILKEIVFRFIAVLVVPFWYFILTIVRILDIVFSKKRFMKEK